MLDIDGLSVRRGTRQVLTDLNLSVSAGEFVAIVGNNGAGKTTLLRTISGLLPHHRGRVSVLGHDPARARPDQIAQAGLGHVPEGRRVFASLSVLDNLTVGATTLSRRQRKDTMERVLSLFPRLQERAAQRAGTLSGGEQQMLAIGRALMARPRILMLDEPSLGLAPIITRNTFKHLRTVQQEWDVAILLAEQRTRILTEIADRTLLLSSGRLEPEQQVPRTAGASAS
ncbi:ABC transporter ATP-binding protein [Streptomyces rugosispiralis]|uniref:ABC transporter ATP-binding protein n=1 Tax=Streptomyces rugosispiralis TaxID=2967341 RepID=A0ABT1V5H1_9ACTN|nr:ABC transporter ATP-binding protein [Streptomyces rugosispiralis]MCQ8192632.1 ABC transporter ATP-binding protein [Streptomyces rugosispiralis]